jgi:hypothetical protein
MTKAIDTVRMTQTAVLRLARRWGVECISREGPPPNASFTVADILTGEYRAVLGVGPRPEAGSSEAEAGAEGYDESILVDPLEKFLRHELTGEPTRATVSERLQLIAAGLLRGGSLVVGHTPSEDEYHAAYLAEVRYCRVLAAPVERQLHPLPWFVGAAS